MRPLRLFSFALVALLALLLGIWYFAYEVTARIPAHVTVSGLSGPVEVSLTADGVANVAASSDRDTYGGLGFAQGAHRAWASLLLRQAALGELALWFGDEAVEIDGHVAALRIADFAKATFDALSSEEKERLEAFASGMNAALQHNQVSRLDALVVLRSTPEPWLAWHALAIERLFAWLTIDIDKRNLDSPEFDAFMDIRAQLSNSFYLSGFDRSAAWAFRRNDVTYVYYRLVHGRSALPLFLDVALARDGAEASAGLALAGTPFLIAGKTGQNLWTLLPQSSGHLAPTSDWRWTGARVSVTSHTPGTAASGNWTREIVDEHVVSFRIDDRGALVFPGSDSAMVELRWSGFSTLTDARAYHALLKDETPVFRLQDGNRLTATRIGLFTADASDSWQHRFSGGILLERSPWTPYHVTRLNQFLRSDDSLSTESWSNDTFSPWAADVVPVMLDALTQDSTRGPLEQAAITYLRNWDFEFSPSSIAASVFDEWASAYTQRTGVFATRSVLASDSALVSTAAAALRTTVDQLRRQFGPDLSTWRWERAQATERRYPFWTYFDGARQWFSETRYAPVQPFGVGHPSALDWGATSDESGDPPATWDIGVRTDRWDQWRIHRNHPVRSEIGGFDEAIADFSSSVAVIGSGTTVVSTTRLTPAEN